MDRVPERVGRNAPCPCGSGKKYKKCCLGKDEAVPLEHRRIDALMQDGYRLSMTGRDTEACERWKETWLLLRERIRPDMRTCQQAEAIFKGEQLIFNWVQDFSLALINAALDDGPRYGEMGIAFCREILAQFGEECLHFQSCFRSDLGELCCLAGRLDEGQQIFLDLIRDVPDSAIGYVRLADVLAHGPGRTRKPIDPDRARALFEQALDKHDADDFDVGLRLEELRYPK